MLYCFLILKLSEDYIIIAVIVLPKWLLMNTLKKLINHQEINILCYAKLFNFKYMKNIKIFLLAFPNFNNIKHSRFKTCILSKIVAERKIFIQKKKKKKWNV